MKNLSKEQKTIYLVIAIIIAVGAAIIFTKGFNFDLKYQKSKRISLYLQKQYEVSDIENIVKEVMPENKTIIQKIEVYGDTIGIIAKDITDEQKTELIKKINEKYETEFKAEETQIETVANARGRDLLKKYIMPFAISTVIIVAYMGIRYNKLNPLKVALKTIGIVIITQITLFSIMAIIRLPIGTITGPLAITAYILSLLAITNGFEKQLEAIVE